MGLAVRVIVRAAVGLGIREVRVGRIAAKGDRHARCTQRYDS